MYGRISLIALVSLLLSVPAYGTGISQISRDNSLYIDAQAGDVLSITTEHKFGSDPDIIYVYGPDGKLQDRLEIIGDTTRQVTLRSGPGVYKVLPVSNTYMHTYTVPGTRPMVVEPFDHQEFVRVTNSRSLYFEVPTGTAAMTVHAHSIDSSSIVYEDLLDPTGAVVHTFELPPGTYQSDHTITDPTPGSWRCRFRTTGYDRCGVWLEGVPNYFSSSPATWFEPQTSSAVATLLADTNQVVSSGARVGVDWRLAPWYSASYESELNAVVEAQMDSARIGVHWAWREPDNDDSDPFHINWPAFDFGGHDSRIGAYYNDVVSQIPDAMPVLLFYWDNQGSSAVDWQLENPRLWTQTQREEYAEFVLATMIHTVAPDLEVPPGSGPAYDFEYVELLNEPNLAMGNGYYQEYIAIVQTVGQRLKSHADPRINSLKIIAPGASEAWGHADVVMENWIGKLIDQADVYVDGVNWHQYGYLHIEECHRYAQDIEKVKGWLATRGDSVADELILMTETNQHGGPPTWWKRQDTFYASRWWAGVCLSALRGGVNFLIFYDLLDDPPGTYNWKGMMFNDGPYDPPVFPGGPPHGRKPIYWAAHFINQHRAENVVSSTCNHPDIAHAVTISDDRRTVTLLLANLFDREIHLDASVVLPPDRRPRDFQTEVYEHGESPSLPGESAVAPGLYVPPPYPFPWWLSTRLRLKPRTIYAVTFEENQGRESR